MLRCDETCRAFTKKKYDGFLLERHGLLRSASYQEGTTVRSHSSVDFPDMIERARGGCADSLGTLLEMYREYLRLIASMQLSQQFRAKFEPSDVVQEAFLQARRGFRDFAGNSEGELVAWLRKILVSQLIMQIRKYSTQARDVKLEQKIHRQVDESSILMAGMLKVDADTPSKVAMRRERAVLLANALAKLPENYRDVIVLRHLKGFRFPEVAQELGQTVDSVKAKWRRAISKLREIIGDESI